MTAGREEYEELVGRAEAEAERMLQAGRASYDQAVAQGRAEQHHLVSKTEVVQAAHAESARVLDETDAEVARLRNECDAYVDDKLGEFEELLAVTLRTVGKGRASMRPPVMQPASPMAGGTDGRGRQRPVRLPSVEVDLDFPSGRRLA